MQFILDSRSFRTIIITGLAGALGLFSQTASPIKLPELLYGEQLGCLAMNIYQEARGESIRGKLAVAAVTMNRVSSKHYPDTICEVVWQRKQFSWTNLTVKHHRFTDFKAWKQALLLAKLFMDGAIWPGVGKAMHYHAVSVSPYWMDSQQLVARYGNHLFYAL